MALEIPFCFPGLLFSIPIYIDCGLGYDNKLLDSLEHGGTPARFRHHFQVSAVSFRRNLKYRYKVGPY